ncbi:MAG TPA: archaeal proteasome endopeptidase complex subunit beta [Methylomirabilota bacterium]|nr:archaeal proteasome endopeptidase complex subunit beta [Methylomirabilota bacterium]
MAQEYYIPGATTVGVICKDGVILASERRVNYGYFVMSKSGKKVFKIADKIGAACAGIVADMQILTREVTAHLNIYSFEREQTVTVRTAAKLMGSLLFERRYFPYLTQTIVGGIDETGAKLFVLDPLGSVIEDKYTAVGSGSEIAMGLLESDFKEGMSVDDAKGLVRKAIKAGSARDIASGEGLDMLIITDKGALEEHEPAIK